MIDIKNNILILDLLKRNVLKVFSLNTLLEHTFFNSSNMNMQVFQFSDYLILYLFDLIKEEVYLAALTLDKNYYFKMKNNKVFFNTNNLKFFMIEEEEGKEDKNFIDNYNNNNNDNNKEGTKISLQKKDLFRFSIKICCFVHNEFGINVFLRENILLIYYFKFLNNTDEQINVYCNYIKLESELIGATVFKVI